jgi:homoserine dehydrogenase
MSRVLPHGADQVKKSQVGIALVGCGTVGGAVAEILLRDRALLKTKSGFDLVIRYIVDRNFTYARHLQLDDTLFETDLDRALEDDEVSIVVELVGGTTKAKEIIEQALQAKKHVVTANKALLAHHGVELLALARKNKVAIGFEASCGGGIPILRALFDGLVANRIEALYGIVNGTCNFILTEMIQKGESYSEALWGAQSKGLAEADPTLDVTGVDSAHKLAIMAAIAFGQRVDFEAIPIEGIDGLDSDDVLYADELGYVVKLLAIGTRMGDGIALRVRPAFISKDHPLAWVSGPFNAVSVYGHATGHTMYYGRGAGGSPTASAVVADIAGIAAGSIQSVFKRYGYWPDKVKQRKQIAVEETVNRYYLRVMVDDTPGALARITTILGKHGINISSVLQDELPSTTSDHDSKHFVPVVITVHPAKEKNVTTAVTEIDALDATGGSSSVITIVDEHPESL